ncbi:hypothetical protein [Allokutzneria oryzae]|uniref:Uncharacterized protein n=1 Tax=Allokutzneria oryzae TaxID=1378989 RepID=A0ABV5ZVF6_9PSEU
MSRFFAPALAAVTLPVVLATPAHAAPTASIKPICDPVTWSVDYTATSSGHAKKAALEVRVDPSVLDEYPDHALGSTALGEPRGQRATGAGTWSERKRLVRGTGAPAGPRPHTRTYTLTLTVTENGVATTASGSCELTAR